MIFDRILTVYESSAGTLMQGTLSPVSAHYCAHQEVYHARYWEAEAAGSRIDRQVAVPFGDDITADLYAIPDDGHVYKIVQAQHGKDADGLPVTTLSLQRMEGNYDIARP